VILFLKITEDKKSLKPNTVRIFNTKRYNIEINNKVELTVAVESLIYTDIKTTFAEVLVYFNR
jgi:hypothetical protein